MGNLIGIVLVIILFEAWGHFMLGKKGLFMTLDEIIEKNPRPGI